MTAGYKTYAVIAVLILKQVLAAIGIQIEDQMLNNAVDVGMLIAAGVFRYVGHKRDLATEPPKENKS